MNLQEKILEKFMDVYPGATFRFISAKTGIQMTRIFRVMNGSPMKLCEYEKFEELISKKDQGGSEELFSECRKKLTQEALKELDNYMNRKLELWKLKNVLKPAHDGVVA